MKIVSLLLLSVVPCIAATYDFGPYTVLPNETTNLVLSIPKPYKSATATFKVPQTKLNNHVSVQPWKSTAWTECGEPMVIVDAYVTNQNVVQIPVAVPKSLTGQYNKVSALFYTGKNANMIVTNGIGGWEVWSGDAGRLYTNGLYNVLGSYYSLVGSAPIAVKAVLIWTPYQYYPEATASVPVKNFKKGIKVKVSVVDGVACTYWVHVETK